MIIERIQIQSGLESADYSFAEGFNLVYSKKNSCGKTTLLRFILYGLGFEIPSTRKIRFKKSTVTITLQGSDVLTIVRSMHDQVSVTYRDGQNDIFVLPHEQTELHKRVFEINNGAILNNLLGVFYADQEKGWTILNRGKVIGSVAFNIEELIRGLADISVSEELSLLSKLKTLESKFKQMESIAAYQENVMRKTHSVVADDRETLFHSELVDLRIKEKQVTKELRRIDTALRSNENVKKFIAEMRLLVRISEDNEIVITEDNIIGLNDSVDILVGRKKVELANLAQIQSEIKQISEDNYVLDEEEGLWEREEIAEKFDRELESVGINRNTVVAELDRVKQETRELEEKIRQKTYSAESVITSLHSTMYKYGLELGLEEAQIKSRDYIFTSNLKELSGAILHKTAFAFKLAYISEIARKFGLYLPIILDSPSGKEVDVTNVEKMMTILQRDFSSHQVVIASIYRYNVQFNNVIQLKNKLLELSPGMSVP